MSASFSERRRHRRPAVLGEQQGDGCNGKNHADDGEGIGKAEDEGLASDDLTKRHDGFLGCDGMIGNTMLLEVAGQLVETGANFVTAERHRLADDVRVELLAFGQHRAERGRADGAAEIAQHVGEARGGGSIRRGDAGGGDGGDRRQHQGLADGADNVRNPELVACGIGRQRNVHEAADRKDRDAEEADVTCIEALHHHRDERDQKQLRQAGQASTLPICSALQRCTWPRYCGRI